MSAANIIKGLLIISGVIVIYFLVSMSIDGARIWGSGAIEYDKTGQVGDFIGGVIGTIINGAAFYFLYLTLQEQRNTLDAQRNANSDQRLSFEKERLETNFFELLRIHRENVAEMRKDAYIDGVSKEFEGRKVIQLIAKDILECREEIKIFFRRKPQTDVYVTEYADSLRAAFKYSNPDVELVKLAKINIPYCIVFFGVDAEGRRILEGIFDGKYKPEFYKPILDYVSLKPLKSHDYFSKWESIRTISDYRQRIRVAMGTRSRRRNNYDPAKYSPKEASKIEDFWYTNDFTKYYGGNQFRLGHYFRHLYQSVKFIDRETKLDKDRKYFYIKTLRAQLSTHEQILLFFNSLSFMGMVWELTPKYKPTLDVEVNKTNAKDRMLITKYQLIRNIPRHDIFGFKIKDFYPELILEKEEY